LNVEARLRLRALARLDLENPAVLGYARLVRDKVADPEPNLRAEFLDPVLRDLGYSLGAEAHLTTGDVDYLFEVGEQHVAIEAKPPSLTFPAGETFPTYHDRLSRDVEQVRKYLSDPRVRYAVLTDGVTFYFFSRLSLKSAPGYFSRRRADELVREDGTGDLDDLGAARVVGTLERWEGMSRRTPLEDIFYESLSKWIEALERAMGKLASAERRREAVSLLNRLVFCRTLEDLGCLEYLFLRRRLLRFRAEEKPKAASKRFLEDVNRWIYEYYDTELFQNGVPDVDLGPLEVVLLGRPSPELGLLGSDLYSFNFADLDFDVLGHVYERYLASVRKDRGIFYTRREVVEAIVEKTVGRLADAVVDRALELARTGNDQASKREVERHLLQLPVLDPACGSGSFLVAAAERIARSYRRWERDLAQVLAERLSGEGGLFRVTDTRDHIRDWSLKMLVGCIHGIDRDPGAVEVAKLNLWLWLVRTRPDFYRWTVLKAMDTNYVLPPLTNNLVVANSLIGPALGQIDAALQAANMRSEADRITNLRDKVVLEFAPNREALVSHIPAIRAAARAAVKFQSPDPREGDPMLYEVDFRGIRFDVVLGNPPYVGEEDHKEMFRPVADSPLVGPYYEGKMDYAFFFVHLGLDLVREDGYVSFILPTYLAAAEGAKRLNERLASATTIEEVFDFGSFRVFAETAPGQNNMIMVLRRRAAPDWRPRIARVLRVPAGEAEADIWVALRGEERPEVVARFEAPRQAELLDGRGALRLAPAAADGICERMLGPSRPLVELVDVRQGIVPGLDRVTHKTLGRLVQERRGREGEVSNAEIDELCQELRIQPGEGVFTLTRAEILGLELTETERRLLRPFHYARQIDPFDADPTVEHEVLYLTPATCADVSKYRRVERHLARFRDVIALCDEVKEGKHEPFHLHRGRREGIFLVPKLVGVRQTDRPCFAYTEESYFVALAANVITARDSGPRVDLLALLAVLNSAASFFWFFHRGKRKGDLLQIDGTPLKGFPVPSLAPDDENVLADLARKVTRLRGLVREALRAFPSAARGNESERPLSAPEVSDWLVKRGRTETGDLEAPGLPTVRREGAVLVLQRPGSELRLPFRGEAHARYVEFALRALLVAEQPRKPGSIAAVLAHRLGVPVGADVSDRHVAQALREMDELAKEHGEPDCDLSRIDAEMARGIDAIDEKVRLLYGLADVSIDDLRNPRAVY
jgi:Eco57I restriction-modification methylase